MDAPVEPKTVEVGPGLSVAAQAATVVAEKRSELMPVGQSVKPADVVDRDFLESIGVRTSGWLHMGKAFWLEHSTQVFSIATALQIYLQAAHDTLPPGWVRMGGYVDGALYVVGLVLKLRIQPDVAVARAKAEVERHTA